MKSAAKKTVPKTARRTGAKVAPRATAKRAASSRNQGMDRVVLPAYLKPRHLTVSQIRRMIAKVAPGPVVIPR